MVYIIRNKRGLQWLLYVLFHLCGLLAVLVFITTFSKPSTKVLVATQKLDFDAIVGQFEADGKPEMAILFLLGKLIEQPENKKLKKLLGEISSNQLIREITSDLDMLKSDPDNIDLYLSIASGYHALGDSTSAFDILLDGIKVSPGATEIWIMMGKLEYENGRENEAITLLREVIKIDKNHAAANNNLAHILIMNENNEDDLEALLYAKMAVYLEPNNGNYLDTLASVYFAIGRLHSAIVNIEKAIKLEPTRVFFREQLARFKRIY